MHLLLINGSSRRDSYNGQLLRWLELRLPEGITTETLTADDVQLPLYCQDIERDENLRVQNLRLNSRFVAANGLLVASPEHNGHISAYLKNLIDWQSRVTVIDSQSKSSFSRKWVMLASASTGQMAGVQALNNARAQFAYLGALIFPPSVQLSNAQERFKAGNNLFSAAQENRIKALLDEYCQIVLRFHT